MVEEERRVTAPNTSQCNLRAALIEWGTGNYLDICDD